MNKSQLLKHLQQVAERATPRKKLNGIHVRAITEELVNVWTKSLQETGTASFSGVGRFDVDKKTGAIKFKVSTLWADRIAGNISSSMHSSESDSDSDDDEGSH
jgi:nucleoid DNA-binding protein